MRLELPPGYKHAVDLRADCYTSVTHIVIDPRPSPKPGETLEGRLTTTLCGVPVDTRRNEDSEGNWKGMPAWGTQPRSSKESYGSDMLFWPGTCGRCAKDLAQAELEHPQPLVPEHADRYPDTEVPENEPVVENTDAMLVRAWDERGHWEPLPPGTIRVGATTYTPSDTELHTRLAACFWGETTRNAEELADLALLALRGRPLPDREAQAQEPGR